MKRILAAAVLLASSASARADDVDDPRVLFAEGRYAAAAQVFEHRWSAKGSPIDGINAVVAWRTAGRYAKALTLLARVRSAKESPTGDAARTADDLDTRLATLTATATIDGKLDRNASLRIDGEPADVKTNTLIVDVGEHDFEIEQPDCERFFAHVTAYPGAKVVIPFKPTCQVLGTVHTVFGSEPGVSYVVDGKPQITESTEADLRLTAGTHHLEVASHDRPVYDETIAVPGNEVKTLRIRFPWRARKLSVIFGITNELRTGQKMTGSALGVTFGLWSPAFHYTFDIGSMVSNASGLEPYHFSVGHPWIAHTLVIHAPRTPVWHGKLGPYRLAFDPEPIAIRFDEIRANSYAGLRVCDEAESRVRAWSTLPVGLSADGPYAHFELTFWPVSVLWHHPAAAGCGYDELPSSVGVGAFVTLTGGWRLF